MNMRDEIEQVDHDGIIGETDLAILVEVDGHEQWWPKSQIEYDDDHIWAPEWLVEAKENEI